MNKRKFQIRFVDKHGFGSFVYFEAGPKVQLKKLQELACTTANEYLEKRRRTDKLLEGDIFHQPYKPFRSVKVVEYDTTNNKATRGGIKFKLVLAYVEAKMKSGRKLRNEWYEAAE